MKNLKFILDNKNVDDQQSTEAEDTTNNPENPIILKENKGTFLSNSQIDLLGSLHTFLVPSPTTKVVDKNLFNSSNSFKNSVACFVSKTVLLCGKSVTAVNMIPYQHEQFAITLNTFWKTFAIEFSLQQCEYMLKTIGVNCHTGNFLQRTALLKATGFYDYSQLLLIEEIQMKFC